MKNKIILKNFKLATLHIVYNYEVQLKISTGTEEVKRAKNFALVINKSFSGREYLWMIKV